MPLHPQAQAHVDLLATMAFADMHTLAPADVRAVMRLAAPASDRDVAGVEDRTLQTAAGDLRARVYHPAPGQQRPVVVFFHGGGFVLGDLETHDGLCRSLADGSGCVVVAVDYPLAPEHPYPAAPRAAYAATAWVADNGPSIGADPARLAVAGDSAGGNLAAGATLQARQAGGPAIAAQLLLYPDVDFRRSNGSMQAFSGIHGNVTHATHAWFLDHYAPDASRRTEPLASPLLARDLSGLPPAHVVTAEYDALRDEGEAYAGRLRDAGVPAELVRYDGMIHEFLRWPFDDSRRALARACAWLRATLAVPAVAG